MVCPCLVQFKVVVAVRPGRYRRRATSCALSVWFVEPEAWCLLREVLQTRHLSCSHRLAWVFEPEAVVRNSLSASPPRLRPRPRRCLRGRRGRGEIESETAPLEILSAPRPRLRPRPRRCLLDAAGAARLKHKRRCMRLVRRRRPPIVITGRVKSAVPRPV